ncbi:hypothetical protein BD289DRAFT_413041 [Coniella lustricola]|uniref:Uncharacterized protein n=1 Tax=Coniella lustricola TaxID=2025994 RepID=A0A2T3A245_9PEZI|nr:hypothetical protein BD289DRAFT_413041 [Coniella lustricola]
MGLKARREKAETHETCTEPFNHLSGQGTQSFWTLMIEHVMTSLYRLHSPNTSMAPINPTELSDPLITETTVPFPVIDEEASGREHKVVFGKHASDTVVVEAVSELVEMSVSTSLFRSAKGENSPLDIVHDASGQAMIFSIGSDGRLYCVFHVDGAAHAWQLLDITPQIESLPSDVVVTAFDVLELKGELHFAVSFRFVTTGSPDEIHQVFWATIKQPNATIDHEGRTKGFSTSEFEWHAIANNQGSRVITKLMCSVNPNATEDPPFTIFAASKTAGNYVASVYAVDPKPAATAPWTVISFGAESLSIVDMQPMVFGGVARDAVKEAGVAILHDAPGRDTDVIRRCNLLKLSPNRAEARGLHSPHIDKLGKLSAMYTSYNTWGSHDVLLAGKGIVFYRFQELTLPCLDADGSIILPDIEFRQVVCKETKLANPRRYVLSILAVSEDDKLYLIEGDRDPLKQGIPTFKCSGLPIRSDVAQIACHYNIQQDSMEFIYTSTKDNQILHLARDSQTSMWTSTDLKVQGPALGKVTRREPQYVATVSLLSKGNGRPVPGGYPVSLRGEPMFVQINGLSYRLNRARPTVVETNAIGQLEIVTTAPEQLGVSIIEAELTALVDRPQKFLVDMASRVTAVMSSIRSKEDLGRMVSANGKPLFANVPEDKLDATASLLSQFGDLKQNLERHNSEEKTSDHVAASFSSDQTLVKWEDSSASALIASSQQHQGDKSWLDKAVDVTIECVGEVLEFLKSVVKTLVKCVVYVGAKILRVVLQVGSKVLSIVVRTTVGLVRSFVSVLDQFLPFSLMDLLGLNLGKYIPQIQDRLREVTLGSLTVLDNFLVTNRTSIVDLFDDMEETLFGSIDKATAPDEPTKETGVERFVRKIIHSPIVKLIFKFNPLQWILEGVVEGLEEAIPDLKLPSIIPLAAAVGLGVSDLLEIIIDTLVEFVSLIATTAADVLRDPKKLFSIMLQAAKKSFKTLFKATRDVLLCLFDTIIRVVKTIPELLTTTWNIPGLTDVWQDWTGQEFTLLNFATYAAAAMVDFITYAVPNEKKDKLFGTKLPQAWPYFKMEPLYERYKDQTNQDALAAMYPGPSLPEHTNPIVMMVQVDYTGNSETTNSKEEEEKNNAASDLGGDFVGDWITLVGAAFKFLTAGIQVSELVAQSKAIKKNKAAAAARDKKLDLYAQSGQNMDVYKSNVPLSEGLDLDVYADNGHDMRAYGLHPGGDGAGSEAMSSPMIAIKVSAAVVAVACMVSDGVQYLLKTKAKDERDTPNTGQIVGMTAGLAISVIGIGIDCAIDVGGPPSGLFRQLVVEEEVKRKAMGAIGAISFNAGSALMTGCTPGCWTKPRYNQMAQTGGSMLGAVAVFTAKYQFETEWGPPVVAVAMATDAGLTVWSIISSIQNLIEAS